MGYAFCKVEFSNIYIDCRLYSLVLIKNNSFRKKIGCFVTLRVPGAYLKAKL